MIRAVIFDFGGVVCFHPTEQQVADAAALCELSPPEFLRAFWKDRLAYDAGQDPADYWRGVARTAGKNFDAIIPELIEREIEFWSHFDGRVLAWMHDLRARGVRTGILSNLPRPLGTRLRANREFIGHFDQVTFSFELGVVKPDRAIYEHAVRGLNAAPGEALFLDDRPENVEGARAAGLQAMEYTGWDEFMQAAARDSNIARTIPA